MNVYEIIKKISSILTTVYNDPVLSQQSAWWIICSLTSQTEAQLIAHETIMLSPEQEATLERWLDELVNHAKPLQYILGSVPFCDVEILVEPPVLIPRVETEEMVLHLIAYLMMMNNTKITLLDLATGSGCIATALAHALPQAQIIATDITHHALTLAEKNIEHNRIHNVTVMESNLFMSIPQGMKFDVIISNPPYIDQCEWDTLNESVTKWEDRKALVAGNRGLEYIAAILKQAPKFIKNNDEMKEKHIPQVCIEFGSTQGDEVKNLACTLGYNELFIHKDLEQKDRFFTGRVDNLIN